MHIKIQNRGIAGGSNAGSCSGYVRYLVHENKWKEEHGMLLDLIPLYDRNGKAVSDKTAIGLIDGNKSHLHSNDAKFYSCIISFSEEELFSMGEDREQRIASVHLVTGKIMDRYAAGFGTDKVKDRNDLLYFYTMHEMREKEDGVMSPGLHVHVIVSRKDAGNRCKLSPMTTYREGSTGVIKRGFNRDSFFRECESVFDSTFGHERKVEESYEYLNAMVHGTVEEKQAQTKRMLEEKHHMQDISAALDARIERMAREAREALESGRRAVADEDKARRDRYWNEYFSYYKPRITELRNACNATYRLYSEAKDKYRIQSSSLAARYERLKDLHAKMDKMEKAIMVATSAPAMLYIISTVIAMANPIPAILLGLVTRIIAAPIAGLTSSVLIAVKKDMRRQAADIRSCITGLRERQSELKELKGGTLKNYLKVRDERACLQQNLDELKKELEKPLSNGMTADLAKRYHEHLKVKETAKNLPGSSNSADEVHSLISSVKDRLSLETELRKRGITLEEILHPNGGTADFLITDSAGSYTASHVCPRWQMAELLNMWERLTGRLPAYKIPDEQEQHKYKMKR